MTAKKDLYIYMVKNGKKRIKKVTLKRLIDQINLECYSKKFFMNEKEAIKYEKEINHRNSKT